jgi:hypothetical protein
MHGPNKSNDKTLNWPAFNKSLERSGSRQVWCEPYMAWPTIPSDHKIANVTADRAYDTCKRYDVIADRGAHAEDHSWR